MSVDIPELTVLARMQLIKGICAIYRKPTGCPGRLGIGFVIVPSAISIFARSEGDGEKITQDRDESCVVRRKKPS